MKKRSEIQFILPLLALVTSSMAFGDLREVEQAQQRIQNAFIDHFLTFSKDKNVMGQARTPEGKTVAEGKKKRFDRDGGKVLPFQSDLTYHDYSYNRTDPNDQNKKEEDRSRLFAFVSHHGGISAAGGSSALERKMYELHKQFSKEDEKNAQKADKQEGVRFRSVFKITTKQVFKNEGGGKDGGKDEPEKIERVELRPEGKAGAEGVGDQSAETILRAGKDQGFEDDPDTLSNGVLLRYAAGQASQAWWNSTLGNLGQRRLNVGIQAGKLPDAPQTSEGIATCDEWGQAVREGIQGAKLPPDQQKALQQEIQQKVQQCNQMAQTDYNVINPRFQKNQNGKGETLKTGDVNKEDAFQRDLRNQLEVLGKAGKESGFQSNWQYGSQEFKSKYTIDFDNGRPKGPVDRTVKEALDSYNNQLKSAQEGIEEVRARNPDLPDMGNPTAYSIAPESKSVMQINQAPVVSAFEEAKVPQVMAPQKSANTYQELLEQGQ